MSEDPKVGNLKGAGGATPLMYAALYESADMVRLFLEGGAHAYATGQALVALKEAGALGATDPASKSATQFLLKTQLEDGSWYVKSRAIPIQPYFESDFPHGHDQWISAAATNWASQALLLAAQ